MSADAVFCCNRPMQGTTAGWVCGCCGIVLNTDYDVIQQPTRPPEPVDPAKLPDPMPEKPEWLKNIYIGAGDPHPPPDWKKGTS